MKAQGKRKKAKCNFKHNALKGTFFCMAKLPIEKIVKFCLFYMDKCFCTRVVQREVEISPKTITDWASFCREVCIHSAKQFTLNIGGINLTVEIDESKFGKTKKVKGHKGRWNKGQWVFGGICRETGEFFMVPVKNRTKSTLLKII